MIQGRVSRLYSTRSALPSWLVAVLRFGQGDIIPADRDRSDIAADSLCRQALYRCPYSRTAGQHRCGCARRLPLIGYWRCSVCDDPDAGGQFAESGAPRYRSSGNLENLFAAWFPGPG